MTKVTSHSVYSFDMCPVCKQPRDKGVLCKIHNKEFYEWYDPQTNNDGLGVGAVALANWVNRKMEKQGPCGNCDGAIYKLDYLCQNCRDSETS